MGAKLGSVNKTACDWRLYFPLFSPGEISFWLVEGDVCLKSIKSRCASGACDVAQTTVGVDGSPASL